MGGGDQRHRANRRQPSPWSTRASPDYTWNLSNRPDGVRMRAFPPIRLARGKKGIPAGTNASIIGDGQGRRVTFHPAAGGLVHFSAS